MNIGVPNLLKYLLCKQYREAKNILKGFMLQM